MTARLNFNGDKSAGDGFGQAAQAVERLGGRARETQQAIAGLNAELGSDAPAAAVQQLGGLAEEYDFLFESIQMLASVQGGLVEEFFAATDAADVCSQALSELSSTADDAVGCLSDLLDGQQDLQTAIDDSNESTEDGSTAWQDFKDTLSMVRPEIGMLLSSLDLVSDYVGKMADDGHESFQKLETACNKLWESFVGLGENETVAQLIDGIAGAIEMSMPLIETYGQSIAWQFKVAKEAITAVVRYTMMAGEAVGIFHEGTVKKFDEEHKAAEAAAKKRYELRQKELEDKKREELKSKADALAARNQELIDPGAAQREEAKHQAEIDAIKEIEGRGSATERINELLEKQRVLVEKISKSGKDPTQSPEVLKNRQELLALEERRNELIRERQQLEELAQPRNIEQAAEAAPDQGPIAAAPAGRANRQGDGNTDSPQKPGKPEEDKLPPGFTQQMGKFRQGIEGNKQLVARQVIKNREEAAVRQHRQELKRRGPMYRDNKISRGGFKYDELKVRTKARGQALHDIRKGNISNEEGQQAVSSLTNGAASMIQKNGNLNQSQIKAMEKLTQAANKQAEQAARMQDQLDTINQRLNEVSGRGANSAVRYQRAGG